MKPMKKPRLVTFDVYMALLDISGSLTPVVEDSLSLGEDRALAFVQVWRSKQMERAAISNSLGSGRTSFRDATAMALDYVAAGDGLELSPEQREELVMAWDALSPWPEADAVVGAVRERGYPTAILSNGDEEMLAAIAGQFKSGFDHILSSQAAGVYKPHPAVYALPEKVLGIASSDYLHVAGSPNDVLGASHAGVSCVWSNRNGDRLLDPAFPPMAEVSDLNGVLDFCP
jgi:2-haloacid dehalogenase